MTFPRLDRATSSSIVKDAPFRSNRTVPGFQRAISSRISARLFMLRSSNPVQSPRKVTFRSHRDALPEREVRHQPRDRESSHGDGDHRESPAAPRAGAPSAGAHVRSGRLRDQHVPLLLVLGDAGHVVGGALGSAGGADEPIRADGAAVLGRLAADAGRGGVPVAQRPAGELRVPVAAGAGPGKVHDRVHVSSCAAYAESRARRALSTSKYTSSPSALPSCFFWL